MALLKGVPLSKEEQVAICKKCGGFCCKYYFFGVGDNDVAIEFHEFRKRHIIRYGKVDSIILQDRCPYTNDEIGFCEKYNDPDLPKLCHTFPDKYRPFWNLRCKLMRVLYARRLIPKDEIAFRKLIKTSAPHKTPFKFFK